MSDSKHPNEREFKTVTKLEYKEGQQKPIGELIDFLKDAKKKGALYYNIDYDSDNDVGIVTTWDEILRSTILKQEILNVSAKLAELKEEHRKLIEDGK